MSTPVVLPLNAIAQILAAQAATETPIDWATIFKAPPQEGRMITATVVEMPKPDMVRLQFAGGVVDISTKMILQPGTAVTFQLQNREGQARLVVQPETAPSSIPQAQTSVTPSRTLPSPSGPAAMQGPLQAQTPAPSGLPLIIRNLMVEGTPPQLQQGTGQTEGATPTPDTPPLKSSSSAPPSPVRQALSEAIHQAISRQGGAGSLHSTLSALTPDKLAGLPRHLQEAIRQVMAQRLPVTSQLSGPDIAAAIRSSGVFLEAELAGHPARSSVSLAPGQGLQPALPDGSAFAPPESQDIKSLLLTLRREVQSWLGDTPAPATSEGTPPPVPRRGLPPAAQPMSDPMQLDDLSPEQIGQKLLHQVEATLDRTRLLQFASLPESRDAGSAQDQHPSQQVLFEIPLALGKETAIAQFQISHDGGKQTATGETSGWRVQFALDVEPLGPVHAMIRLHGTQTGVTLWAERAETADLLREASDRLRDQLTVASFEVRMVDVIEGHPASPPLTTGFYIDRIT